MLLNSHYSVIELNENFTQFISVLLLKTLLILIDRQA